MSYFPTILSANRRYRYGLSPLRLQNWYAQPIPSEANAPVRAVLLPTPGLVSRVDIGKDIQGVFCENGVRNGVLFVVAGGYLYSISTAWAATQIGYIGGTGEAVFAGLRDKLYVARGEKPWQWDGTSLTQVSDVDAPNVRSMLVLSQRLVASEEGADTYYWSDTLDGTDWEALGFATAEQRPDVIRRMIRLSGQIVAFGASSIEILRATGSSTLPFANITSQSIDETNGILCASAYAPRGDKAFFIGGNLCAYVMAGFTVQKLPVNGELEDDLRSLSDSDRALTTCWAYTQGSNEFFVVRPYGKQAYVLDVSTGLWHTRKTWGGATYAPRWYASAYGYDVVGTDGGSKLYTFDTQTYTDDGAVIERIATLRPAFKEYEAIGSMCVDLQAYGRPATGDGSAPKLMIDISTDGRSDRDDRRSQVMLDIGADGIYRKPTVWGLGLMPPGEAATITMTLTDPIGLSFSGVWLNEGPRS